MDTQNRQKVVKRLKSIEGHIRGIERMVEADTYCIDVLKQTNAVQRAIDKVNTLIMQQHLNECVTTAMRGADPKERQRVIGEIVDVFQMSSKL